MAVSFVEVGHAAVVAAVAVDDAAETLIQWLLMHHVDASCYTIVNSFPLGQCTCSLHS